MVDNLADKQSYKECLLADADSVHTRQEADREKRYRDDLAFDDLCMEEAATAAKAEAKRLQEEADREASLFNWSLFRALMKDRRLKLGYRDARAFAKTIYLRSRVEITADSYYKIESGKQGIKAEQFMALNIALWGSPWPEQIMGLCIGTAWAEIASSTYPHVPDEWAVQNAVIDALNSLNLDSK